MIAVCHIQQGERPYVIRATIDTDRLNNLLGAGDLQHTGDLFLINQEGVIQTPSRLFGSVLTKFSLPEIRPPIRRVSLKPGTSSDGGCFSG